MIVGAAGQQGRRTATEPKSMRMRLADETPLNAYFTGRSDSCTLARTARVAEGAIANRVSAKASSLRGTCSGRDAAAG